MPKKVILKKSYVMVASAKCPTCGDLVYSRALHDMRFCKCGATAIDGGRSYMKLAFKGQKPTVKRMRVYATHKQLYDDWNHNKHEFGRISLKSGK